MKRVVLTLLVGCGGAAATSSEVPAEPTAIGASDALRAEEERLADGPVGASLAAMAEADLTTPEGLEVLSFSAASTFAVATFTLALQAHASDVSDCVTTERSETSDGKRTVVRSNDCASGGSSSRRMTGELIVESRQESCGEWVGLELRSWTIRDDRNCGSTDHPKGTRIFSGRIVSNECANTMTIELLISGEGWEERQGQCHPMRETAVRYQLRHGGGGVDSGPLNGEGEVGIAGVGRARVETIDEVVGQSDCRSEAESGLTRARAGGHVAEVTYDGATECTEPGSAPYTLDGQPAGTTTHACAAGGAPSGSTLLPLALVLLGRRRRRYSSSSPRSLASRSRMRASRPESRGK